jgi:hypothetical protein
MYKEPFSHPTPTFRMCETVPTCLLHRHEMVFGHAGSYTFSLCVIVSRAVNEAELTVKFCTELNRREE